MNELNQFHIPIILLYFKTCFYLRVKTMELRKMDFLVPKYVSKGNCGIKNVFKIKLLIATAP